MEIKDLLDKALGEGVSIRINADTLEQCVHIDAENFEPGRKLRTMSADVPWRKLNTLDVAINEILNRMLEEVDD